MHNTYSFNYNMYHNSLFGGIRNLQMYGGSWDFSKNIYITDNPVGPEDNYTMIVGNSELKGQGAPITIRWADISFDTTFKTENMDGSNNHRYPDNNLPNAIKYYNYKLDNRTTIFSGKAAIDISNARYNLLPPKPKPTPPTKCSGKWGLCNDTKKCCPGLMCNANQCQ